MSSFPTNRQWDGRTDEQTHGQENKQTYAWKDMDTDRQTDRYMER